MHRIAAVLLLTTPAAAEPAYWETFDRPAYGFRIEVPDHLFTLREKGPDRVSWISETGDVRLDVATFYGGRTFTPEELLAERSASIPGRVVTYEASGDDWAVASGFESPERQRIFYERFEADADGVWVGFTLRWDESRRDDVDGLVKRIGDSLDTAR